MIYPLSLYHPHNATQQEQPIPSSLAANNGPPPNVTFNENMSNALFMAGVRVTTHFQTLIAFFYTI
jgi:hypothetical protein